MTELPIEYGAHEDRRFKLVGAPGGWRSRARTAPSVLLGACLALAGCRKGSPQEITPPETSLRAPGSANPAPASSAVPETAASQAAPSTSETAMAQTSGSGTVIQVDDGAVVISREAAETIRAALIARLEASTLPERNVLMGQATYGPIEMKADRVSMGFWTLMNWNGRLTLFSRGSTRTVYYEAPVSKVGDKWIVAEAQAGELLVDPVRQ